MPSPKIKRNLQRIIPFGLIWLFFSIVYTLLERGLLGNFTIYPSTGNPYNFTSNLLITPLTALVAGLLIGVMEIIYFNKIFIRKSFIQKIVYKTIIYLAIIVFFLLGISVLANAVEMQSSFFDYRVWNNTWAFFRTYSFLSVAIYMASIVLLSQFYAEVSDNIGQGTLNNFFMGRYHRPKEEERIFMFLDMKSSTTIAEQLGHVRYFELLRDYYADLSDPIIRYSGEIYQYVGDEIIVSWILKHGLHNNNCLQCFFAIKMAVSDQSAKYHKKFGLAPSFKAGFHLGKVTTGEIGALKKEIVFTGDVLNTTSRIQGLCNKYAVDLLVSEDLVKQLNLDHSFRITNLGETELRGRDEKIGLFTVSN